MWYHCHLSCIMIMSDLHAALWKHANQTNDHSQSKGFWHMSQHQPPIGQESIVCKLLALQDGQGLWGQKYPLFISFSGKCVQIFEIFPPTGNPTKWHVVMLHATHSLNKQTLRNICISLHTYLTGANDRGN